LAAAAPRKSMSCRLCGGGAERLNDDTMMMSEYDLLSHSAAAVHLQSPTHDSRLAARRGLYTTVYGRFHCQPQRAMIL